MSYHREDAYEGSKLPAQGRDIWTKGGYVIKVDGKDECLSSYADNVRTKEEINRQNCKNMVSITKEGICKQMVQPYCLDAIIRYTSF